MENQLFVLYYGPSHEKEVSASTKDYYMDLYKDSSPILIKWIDIDNFQIDKDYMDTKELTETLKNKNGTVIIAAHGEYAEDGYIQEVFETNNIPFTGASSRTSKLCIDKISTQSLVESIVDVPKSYAFDILEFDYDRFTKNFENSYPCVLKPAKMGSSVYTYLVKDSNQLLNYINDLQQKELKDNQFIIQEYIKGIEYSVGVMLNNLGTPQVIAITEIRPADEFFTYNSKYSDSRTVEITPAEIPVELQNKLEDLSLAIYNKIDPRNFYGRLDFIIKDNTPYFLEINTLPGFSKTSIVPQQLAAKNMVDEFKINLLKYVS